MKPTQKIISLTIDKMTFGGRGLGKHDQKIVFVEGAIPGDVVEAEITCERPSYVEAKVKSILHVSPSRVPSPCTYSDACGGCQWLNVPYETGLAWKQSFIEDAFTRILRLKELPKLQMHASPDTHHYRNRILLRGTVHPDGGISLGYLRANTWEQVHIRHCYIADPAINKILEALISANLTKTTPQKFRLELQNLPYKEERNQPNIFATVHPLDQADLSELVQILRSLPSVSWAGLAKESQKIPVTEILEDSQGFLYHTSPGQFQQVNLKHNHNLRRLIQDSIKNLSSEISSVLDLFCGSGNLSLGLSESIGIEANEEAIRLANLNAEINKLPKNQYSAEDALKSVQRFVRESKKFDGIILDPPRAGFKEGMPYLKILKPKHIFYVSCDPMTLARDLKELSSDYDIIEVHGFDFFPHTYHIETFVHLRSK